MVSRILQYPTTATLGLDRRRRMLEIARRWDATLMEEDAYSLLKEDEDDEDDQNDEQPASSPWRRLASFPTLPVLRSGKGSFSG